jgi:hypothetical protein
MPNDYRFIAGAPEKSGALSHINVMIATPIGQRPCASYAMSLAATVHSLAKFGVRYQLYLHQGNCHVDDVRNEIIRDFIESDCTDLFFIDDDLGWRPQSVIRLIQVPGDIVAGVYPHRSDGDTYPFHPGFGVRQANEHGLYEMHKVPTGFMRIRRPVLEKLYQDECAKGRKFWRSNEPPSSGRLPFARIVERGFVSELGLEGSQGSDCEYHSGDYVLCLKARRAGFTVWADIEMPFEHVGEKVWSGHLGDKLRRDQNVDHPAFADAIAALKTGDVSAQVFEHINAFSPNSAFAMPGKGLFEAHWMAKCAVGHILECGSGLSTLVMGIALAGTEHCVYALEHDLAWLRTTARWLEQYEIGNVTLIYAPIMPTETGDWYGVEPSDLPDQFDGVLIDGPKRDIGRREVLFDRLGPQMEMASTWIVDDCADPSLEAMLRRHCGDRQITYVTDLAGGIPHKVAVAQARPLAVAAE